MPFWGRGGGEGAHDISRKGVYSNKVYRCVHDMNAKDTKKMHALRPLADTGGQ